jgi:hypothetical protein
MLLTNSRGILWPGAVMLCAGLTPDLRAGGGCVVPHNETCAGQIVFKTDDLPYEDTGILGCVNDVIDKPYWDIFYRYDCTVSREHTFEMCDSDGDTYIRIYIGGCGWVDGEEFAVADDECPGSPPNADPLLTVALEAGTSYWIELGTWRPDAPWGAPNLPFRFSVSMADAPCPWDLDGNDAVDVNDFLLLLAVWGTDPGGPPDFDGDGDVGITDFLVLIGNWGPCG